MKVTERIRQILALYRTSTKYMLNKTYMFQVLIITCLKVWFETVFQVLPTVLTVKLLKRKERMPLKKTEQNRGTDTLP